MASQAPAENPPNDTDTFAPLRQLVLRINSENYAQEVTDNARDLNAEERQLLVDVLSTAIYRTKTLSQRHALAWKSLIKIALSAHIFAQNRTIKSEYTTSDSGALASIKIFSEKLVEWVHLSHPNILPLYAAFLENEEHPCLVSPHISNVKICEHARELKSDQRLPLILDVVDGLCYLHQLNIVHGGLCPETVMISDDGRAMITDLEATSEEQDSNLPIRYSPPEVLLGDDTQATKAMDTWFFACLSHEVLSGSVPFCQFPNDFKATAAIGKGHKPARPGCEGRSGDEISDMIWNVLLLCWEYEAADRLTCLKVRETLSHMRIGDHRSEPRPMVPFEALKTSEIDPEPAKNILIKVLGSHQQSSSQVPKHLRDILSRLVLDSEALGTTRVAARTLSRDDTQTLVDFLELVIQDLPYLPESNLTGQLLESIMDSSHIVPRYYRVDGVRYDSALLVSEVSWGKIYAGRGSKFHVCDTESGLITYPVRCLALWANASHPNLLPFHGVFHEGTESPRLRMVLPYLKGTLEEYALALPQKSRLPLISDVANGLAYLQNTLGVQEILTGQDIVISDEGRALLTTFGLNYTLFSKLTGTSLSEYTNRFTPPSKLDSKEGKRVIWSLGCVYYLVFIFRDSTAAENVLISDDGRGLITDFGTSHINTATAATGSLSSTTLRFSAPETVLGNRKPTKEFDIWSLGCLFYAQDIVVSDEGRALLTAFGLNYTLFWKLTGSSLGEYTGCFTPPSKGNPKEGKRVIWSLGCVYYLVLSRKLPYHQFSDEQVYPSKNEGELLMRPDHTDAEMDEIDDRAWDMIMKCSMLANMEIEDQRPPATPLSLPEIQAMRSRPEFNLYRAEIVAEVLRGPLSELIENHTKDVAMAIVDLERDDVQTVVNFLDQVGLGSLL
ncbi:Tyrosine-protein kinase CSK [Leucoagaricus sp. SymC.cos]|nr:Tyrosine-protein kinase CSK [Leucoagaricus sp. SymC.cos]